MDHFHQYLLFSFNHLTVIIEIIFATILIISTIWLVNNLRAEEGSGHSATDLKEIEEALRRVLANTSPPAETAAQAAKLIHDDDDDPLSGLKLSNVVSPFTLSPSAPVVLSSTFSSSGSAKQNEAAVQGSSNAADSFKSSANVVEGSPNLSEVSKSHTGGQQFAELEALKSDLAVKSKTIGEVQATLDATRRELEIAKAAESKALAAAAYNLSNSKETSGGDGKNSDSGNAGGGGEALSGLQSKITELEAKLSEYQIIEDDIANLSLYKQENTRLKNEMEKLKTGQVAGASAISAAPVASTAPVVSTAPSADANLASSPLSLSTALPDSPSTEGQSMTAAATPPGEDSGQKLIEEFENFMKGAGGG